MLGPGSYLHYFNLFSLSSRGHDRVNRAGFKDLTLLVIHVFLDLSPSLGSDFLCSLPVHTGQGSVKCVFDFYFYYYF